MNKEILLRKLVEKLKTKDEEWWSELPRNDELFFDLLMQCIGECCKPNDPHLKVVVWEDTFFYELIACCNEANPDFSFDNNTTKDIIPRTLIRIREYLGH